MFKTPIQSTPLSGDIANRVFKNVWGDTYGSDVTFVSTCRGLIYDKIGDDEELIVSMTSSSFRSADVEESEIDGTMDLIQSRCNVNKANRITLHNLSRISRDESGKIFEAIVEKFCEKFEGYRRIEKATAFYKPAKFDVACFVKDDIKSSIIITSGMDTQRFHYLQCGIPVYLPWIYTDQSVINEKDMKLIKSLSQKDKDVYLAVLQEIAEVLDFEGLRTKELLSGYATAYQTTMLEETRRKADRAVEELRDLRIRENEVCDRYDRLQNEIVGLQTRIDKNEGDEELIDYFSTLKKTLRVGNISGSVLTFECRGYFDYFDSEHAKRVIKNDRSYIYRPNGNDYSDIIPASSMREIMTKIFVTREWKMRVCAAYTYDLRGHVDAYQGYSYDASIYGTYTPNPHTDRYQCIGNYARIFNEMIEGGADAISIIEQASASAKSINFADDTVMREFMMRLYEKSNRQVNVRCIELPDGRVVTPKEAAEIIKERKESEEK